MGSSPMGMKLSAPGQGANAMGQVRAAIDALEQALTSLPAGTDIHKAVSESITKLAKHVGAADVSPGVQRTAQMGLAQGAQQQAPYQAFLRALGAGGGGGGSPFAPGASPGAMQQAA